jgi:hypothetical protein
VDLGGHQVTSFLEQLGAKVVDRWLAGLLLPGLLWLCCVAVAAQLGWEHAVDPRAAQPLLRRLAGERSGAQALLLVAGALGGSAAAGLAATGLATVLRRAWTLPGGAVPAKWLRQWRRRRWEAADRLVTQQRNGILDAAEAGAEDGAVTVAPQYGEALARRDLIGLEPAERPTWIGDRWLATGMRIHRAYGLDLTVVWPRLWALAPDALRNDIAVAQLAYQEASITVSWAAFYGAVGLFWGPALIIAAGLAVTGTLQARDATGNLCELVESTCDLYGRSLAEQLRIDCPERMTPEAGKRINEHLRRKDLPPG